MPVSFAMVEDDNSFSSTLKDFFSLSSEVSCLAVFSRAELALERVAITAPDVWLVDINLPQMSGIDFVSRLRTVNPAALCLILTMYEDSTVIFEALRAGASGYLLKRTPAKDIVAAILQVHAGGSPMSPEIARRVIHYFHPTTSTLVSTPEMATLAARELEVLTHLAKGYLYKEIGDMLGISTHTVNTYIRRIYEKLQVRSRSQAVAKYRGLQ